MRQVSQIAASNFVSLLAILCASTNSGCTARTDDPSRAAANSPLGFQPIWRGAKGDGAQRMVVAYEPNAKVYQSIWHSPDGDRLVVLDHVPANLFGNTFTVYLFDKNLRILRTGNLHTSSTCNPYKLFEIRTDSDTVPLPYRDKWTLAVGCYDWQKWDASKPVQYSAYRYGHEDPVTPETANIIAIDPVEWDDLEPRFSVGTGRIYNADVTFRPAEP